MYWTSFENYVAGKEGYHELSNNFVHNLIWKMDPSFNDRLKILYECNDISFQNPFKLNTRYMIIKHDTKSCQVTRYYDNYYLAYGNMILTKDLKSSFKVIDLEELKSNLYF